MLEVASLIVVNLIIAVLIGAIIGYLIGKNSCNIKEINNKKGEAIPTNLNKTSVNPIFKKSSGLDNKPLVISTPKPAGKDNLKKIKGINSQIETDLNSLGIYHYEQIASWSSKNCDWIEAFLLLPNWAKKNQWVEQAKILSMGKDTVYSQKIDSGEIIVD